MKKLIVELEVEDHITEQDIKNQLKEKNKTASFKSRKKMAWISFYTVLGMIPVNYFLKFQNESLIEIIAIGLLSLVGAYWGTVSYEFVKLKAGK